MSSLSVRLRVCFHCGLQLSRDDEAHYVYACHDCTMREHDRARRAVRDPDHPDVAGGPPVPVEIGTGVPVVRQVG